jgi:hypothetical protein
VEALGAKHFEAFVRNEVQGVKAIVDMLGTAARE